MFVVVYEINPERFIAGRRLGPHEKPNAAKFATMAATYLNRQIDWDIVSWDGRGDIRVEFRPQKRSRSYLKESQSYYFKRP